MAQRRDERWWFFQWPCGTLQTSRSPCGARPSGHGGRRAGFVDEDQPLRTSFHQGAPEVCHFQPLPTQGSAAAARTARSKFDGHDAPTTGRSAGQDAAAMPMLRRVNATAIMAEKLVTQ
jgi:hypothetical protein